MNEEKDLEEHMDTPDELDQFIEKNAHLFADIRNDYKKYKIAYLMKNTA